MDFNLSDFDGAVSLLIACFELVFFINLLIFAEKNQINKIATWLVLLLAGYQIYEFFICYFEVTNVLVVFLALADITFLPPLALVLALLTYGVKNNRILLLPFLPFAFFTVYFAFNMEQLAVTKCTVIYAVYNYPLGFMYGAFYYGLTYLSMLFLLLAYFKSNGLNERKLLMILLIGFVTTFVPTNILFLLSKDLVVFVESLQCKVAFILAFSLMYFGLKNKKKLKEKENSIRNDS